MIVDLSSGPWQLRGFWPYAPHFRTSAEDSPTGAVTDWMPAKVPGCVIDDLVRDGLVEDPYYEMNSLKCEWVENRWWVYRTEFMVDETWQGRNISVVFLGVDYKCHIYLNGEKLCEHEGMFEPVRLDISGACRFGTANKLEVVLESAPDEMGQLGYTSQVHTQKSRFGYKWDFATRLVHTGIWDDVYLDVKSGAGIDSAYVTTSVQGELGVVDVRLTLSALSTRTHEAEAVLSHEGTEAARQRIGVTAKGDEGVEASLSLRVTDPQLWWPNGYGGQPLYDLTIQLFDNEELCDRYDWRVGIRSLEYERNEGAEDSLPYVPRVNGTRIYLTGVNITPLDHMIGSVTQALYEKIVTLARDGNVNLIRVWGGGVIEKKAFFDICDRLGILVWQEFNQSSSGLENVPPKDQGYLQLLERNAAAALLGRRNHVSLTFWSGGNELTNSTRAPATYEDPNIAMLRKLVGRMDPQRILLPTSPSGPSAMLDVTAEGLGKNHDVHGPWQYQGTQGQYELFNRSDSMLHSEFGVDGFTNPVSATRFLSEENRKPGSVDDNPVWRHHGEWWDTSRRDRTLFGEQGSLATMMLCSQFVQAEGLRYAVESNRRRAFRNCGSIIWQFNEPWPNLFCTSLVDYYGQPKAAYWWVKRAYAPLAVSLRYDRLVYEPGSRFSAQVWVADNRCAFEGTVSCTVLDLKGRIHHQYVFEVASGGSHSFMAGAVEFETAVFPQGFWIVKLRAEGGDACENDYLFSCSGEPAFAALFTECSCESIAASVEVDGHHVVVSNQTDTVCVFAKLTDGSGDAVFDENSFTLLPGEKRRVACSKQIDADNLVVEWLNRKKPVTG